MMSPVGPLIRLAMTVGACLALSTVLILGSNAPTLALAAVLSIALLISLLWFRVPRRRYLLAALFLTAPFDISKAVVAPLDRFYSPGLYITISQAVMLVLTLVWGLEVLLIDRRRLPLTRLDATAAVFLALVWIGALHAPGAGTLVYASAMSYTLCVLGYYVVSHAMRDKQDLRLILVAIVVGLLFQAAYVGAQVATRSFLTLPGAKVGGAGVSVEIEHESTFRPLGAFQHPNALADYLTLVVPPALALSFMGGRRVPTRIRRWAAVVASLAGLSLVMTLSRAGWAACLTGASFVGLILWRQRIIGSGQILAGAGIVLATVLLFPRIIERLTEPDSRSTESRILLVDQAITIIKAHPLIGVGFASYNRAAFEARPPKFAYISEDYQEQLLQLVVHNHYLLLAAEMGLPTMLLWMFLMFRFVAQAWPMSRWHDPGLFALGIGLAGSLAGQVLYLSGDNYYADIRIYMLWLCAGLLQAVTRLSDKDGTPRMLTVPA